MHGGQYVLTVCICVQLAAGQSNNHLQGHGGLGDCAGRKCSICHSLRSAPPSSATKNHSSVLSEKIDEFLVSSSMGSFTFLRTYKDAALAPGLLGCDRLAITQ